MRCISFSTPSDNRIPHEAVYYPLLFLTGQVVAKDYNKAVALLQDIQQCDSAKIILAYCYKHGLGVEQNNSKAEELLNSVKDSLALERTFFIFNSGGRYGAFLNDTAFAIDIIERIETLGGDIANLSKILRIQGTDKKLANELSSKLRKNPEKYAKPLANYYIETKQYSKLKSLIETTKKDFSDLTMQLYYIAFIEYSHEVAEIALKLDNKNSENRLFYRSYFYYVGLGCKQNKEVANKYFQLLCKNSINLKHCSFYLENLASKDNLTEDQKEYIYKYAKALNENKDFVLLSMCYSNGIGVEVDYRKAIEGFGCIENLELPVLHHVLRICERINRPLRNDFIKKIHVQVMREIIEKNQDLNTHVSFSLIFAYANGYGCTKNYEKSLEVLKKLESSILPTLREYPSRKIELYKVYVLLEYCYKKGLGTPINKALASEYNKKLVALEPKIKSDIIIYALNRVIDCFLYDSNSLRFFCDDADVRQYYMNKRDTYIKKFEIAKLNAFELDILKRFDKINDEFKSAKGDKLKKESIKKKVAEIFKEVIANKSPNIETVALKLMFGKKYSIDVRVSSLPHIVKCAETYAPHLHNFVIECYKHGKGTPLIFERCGYHAFKYAMTLDNEFSIYPFLDSINNYGSANMLKKMVEVLDVAQKKHPDEIRFKAYRARLMSIKTSPIYNPKKAEEEFAKILPQIKDVHLGDSAYLGASWGIGNFYTLAWGYKFLMQMENLNGMLLKAPHFYRELTRSYMYGIGVAKDNQKAIESHLKYIKYNPYPIPYRCFLMWIWLRNIGDSQGYLKCIDTFVKEHGHSFDTMMCLGIAYWEGFGVEKDTQKAKEYFKDAMAKYGKYNSLLYYIKNTKSTTSFGLPEDARREIISIAETSKKINAYDLMLAYYYLGNTEKALEYARKADNDKSKRTKRSNEVAILLNDSNIENQKKALEIAKTSKRYSSAIESKLYLANCLYEGKFVEQNKAEAFKIASQVNKLYFGDGLSGMSVLYARLWLWRYYWENGDKKMADNIKAQILKFKLMSSTPSILCAFAFKDDRSTYLTSSVGFKRNDEYVKYWLNVAEKEEASMPQWADTTHIYLYNIYKFNDLLKDELSAERIAKYIAEKSQKLEE